MKVIINAQNNICVFKSNIIAISPFTPIFKC